MTKRVNLKRLRSECDKLWYQACLKKHGTNCELCGKLAVQVHHFFPKSRYGHIRYSLKNGIPLCVSCHFQLHHSDITFQNRIRDKRGDKWYLDLKAMAQVHPTSYITPQWYTFHKKELSKYLE